MNLANKLTIFRIILVPIMVLIPYLGIDTYIMGIPLTWVIVAIIFLIAAITDKLDGYIARSRNQITNFGKFLDPIADKILVLAAMIMLVESNNRLPAWIPIIVLFREFVVSGYRLIAVEQGGKVIAASIWGKLKTVTQMSALVLALIDMHPYATCLMNKALLTPGEFTLNAIASLLMTISVIATIFSGWDYIKGGKELLKNK